MGFGIYALTVVLLLVGMAFLSWRRHGDARKLPGSAVRGHRLRLLAANLAGALTYVPFLVGGGPYRPGDTYPSCWPQ